MKSLPAILGRVKATHEFYAAAAEHAVSLAAESKRCLGVAITYHGFLVVQEVSRIEPRFHVMTINWRSDPDHLADTMAFCARSFGFDSGIRKGRRKGEG